jgi:hypothetical protein
MENIKVPKHFSQVCVWPGTLVGEDNRIEFQAFMYENFKVKAFYLEEIKTAPDMENGCPVEGTGGRNDVFFAVHQDDISHFAIPRLQAGIRWIEDVLDNESRRENGSVYPARVAGYRTW